jgi:hypothetical protein
LGQQSFSGTGGAQKKNVALLQLHVSGHHLGLDPFVMIVHGYGKDLFGSLLADHVLIQDLLDLVGLRHIRARSENFLVVALLCDDVVAEIDAFVADVNGRPRYQFSDFVLALSAKRANEVPGSFVTMPGHVSP